MFLCTDYVPGHESDLEDWLRAGNEVANHCASDRSYAKDSESEFETVFLQAEGVCEGLRKAASTNVDPTTSDPFEHVPAARWFRAPHGALSAPMRRVLSKHGFLNALTDCYANDPWIDDPSFISDTMVSMADHGSIAVIHMPERGFREYNFLALRWFLEGIKAKGM